MGLEVRSARLLTIRCRRVALDILYCLDVGTSGDGFHSTIQHSTIRTIFFFSFLMGEATQAVQGQCSGLLSRDTARRTSAVWK